MDLSKLSNEDLMALKNGDYSGVSDEGLKYLKTSQQPSLGEKVSHGFERLDAYTGAPTRAAVSNLVDKNFPYVHPGNAVLAAYDQMGRPASTAPTGAQQMGALGVPEQGPISPNVAKLMALSGLKTGGLPGLVLGGGLGLLGAYPRGTLGFVAQNAENPINAVPTVLRNVVGGANKAIKGAAAQNIVNQKVKNIAEFSHFIADKVNEAKNLYRENQLVPRMAEQQALVSGKTVKINPDDFIGYRTDLDSEMNALKDQIKGQTYGANSYQAPKISEIEIPAEDALRYRAMLNKGANYGPQELSNEGLAEAKDAAAEAAGNQMRSKINALDPKVAELSDELRNKYALQKAVVGRPDKPIAPTSVIKGTELGKKSNLAQFDQLAGTDLYNLGKRSDLAQRMYNESRAADVIGSPWKVLMDKAKGYGYDALGPAAENVAPYSSLVLDPVQQAIESPITSPAIRLSPWLQFINQQEKEKNK